MVLTIHSSIACKLLFIVQLNIIAFFLFTIVMADDETIIYYDYGANKTMSLGNYSAVIILNGTLAMKQYKNTTDSVVMRPVTQDTYIAFENNKKLHVSECKSFKEYSELLLQPFVITMNANGTIKHILVQKTEIPLTYNMKFFFAVYMQNQIVKLLQESKKISFQMNELIFYGNCDVTYNASNELLPSQAEDLYISKVFDTKSCSGLDDTDVQNKFDYCTAESEEDLEWNSGSNLDIQRTSVASVLRNYVVEDNISFKPFKGDSRRLSIHHITRAELLVVPYSAPVIEFNDENAEIITANNLIPVDESLLNDTNTENQELREIYKALSCYKTDQSLYLDYVAHFLKCNS